MAIENKMTNEKLQYNINRETAKISPLSSEKTDKYEYLVGKKFFFLQQKPNNRTNQIFIFSLREALEKQLKPLDIETKTYKSKWRA